MSVEPRASRFVLARAGIGLAAQVVTTAVELPGRTIRAGLQLPATILGAGARSYLQLTHTVNGLAVKGDEVLELVFPPRKEQPAWATFDEDEEDGEPDYEVYTDDEDLEEDEFEDEELEEDEEAAEDTVLAAEAGAVEELPLDLDGLDEPR